MFIIEVVLTSLLAISALVTAVPANWKIGDTVETTSGPVQGHASDWQPSVSEYLGIPFAVPPVGNLR
jgi:hypothetical protein